MIPTQLESEVRRLRHDGHRANVIEAEGWHNVVFERFPIPAGFSVSESDLLVKVPLAYPNGGPDMFWVEEGVMLASGVVPKGAESIEQALGRRWRRFSWHFRGWNPASCDLGLYIEFVNRRLSQAV